MIDENRLETTPVQHIRNLMRSIKDDKLTVTYYDPIEPPYRRTYDVSCTETDTDECISKYEALTQALEAIGAAREKLNSGAKMEDVLTSDQIAVWNTYVSDFEETFDAGKYDLAVIYDMRERGAPLDDNEQEIIECHHEWFEEQCRKRLPPKAYSPMLLVNRAKRYESLVSHNAPKAVVSEEGRCLAEEMILYHYCVMKR